ncbi:HAMP domain-containing sensor histidine kinase, partial [Bacillus pumilus]|uniref:HAMP domain-containing sensor histidine kinase n=1 Tax=Bacillus pumilus TaxID=1408 RepID=UPI0011A936FA
MGEDDVRKVVGKMEEGLVDIGVGEVDGMKEMRVKGEKEDVIIKVKDRGEGIEEEMLKDMLVRFIRWKEKGR